MSGITQRSVLRPDTPRRFDKCASKMQNELHHSDKNQLKLQKKDHISDGVPFVGVQNLRPGTWPTKAPHGPKGQHGACVRRAKFFARRDPRTLLWCEMTKTSEKKHAITIVVNIPWETEHVMST